MEIATEIITVKTQGRGDIIDITSNVQGVLSGNKFTEGSVTVFAIGSTAGITTIEFEPGLVKADLPRLFDLLAPYSADYTHHKTWGDDNGSAHVLATLLGPSLVVPFVDGQLILGTWQQIVCVEFDTRPRSRKVVIQLIGKC